MTAVHEPATLTFYSDVLCIYAYVSQIRVDTLAEKYSDRIRLERRFCSSFGNTEAKIGEGWKEKGGWEGYAANVLEVAGRFPHVEVAQAVWGQVRPASSHGPHLLLKAIQLSSHDPAHADRVAWAMRRAFFAEARNIASWEVQCEVATEAGADLSAATAAIHDGTAFAALEADYDQAKQKQVEGSPTLLLPEGRQKLYGDVGFRIMDANISELLKSAVAGEPSWC